MTAHLMNCPHSEEGWCLSCLKVEWERWDELTKPAEIVHSLEPQPCEWCAAKDKRIAELEEMVRARDRIISPYSRLVCEDHKSKEPQQ